MRHIAILTLIGCLLTGCSGKGEKAALIRLKYHKGQTFDIKYQTYAQTNDRRVPQNRVVRMLFKVDSIIGDSLYVLSAKLDYVRVRNDGLFSNEEYASDKAEEKMNDREKSIHQDFKAVRDLIYTLTIDNRGKILKPFALSGGREIDKKYNLVQYENCQIVFPEEAVGIGDEWTNELDVPGTAKGRRMFKYTIESIKDGVMRIDLVGKFQPYGRGSNSKNFYGHYLIDEETKMIISAKYKLEGKMFLEGEGAVGVTIASRSPIVFSK